MSLTNTTTKVKYAGNGATTSFAITFDIILADTEVKVILRDETDPLNITETLQVVGVGYNLTGSSPPGIPFSTTVEMVIAPTATQELLVYRDVPLTQLLDYLETSEFRAESQEDGLDKLTAVVQELGEQLSRAALLSRATDATLPLVYPEPLADNLIGWDATGLLLRNFTAADILSLAIGQVLFAVNNLSDVADAGISATNLGLGATNDVTHNKLTTVAEIVSGAGVLFETFLDSAEIATPSNPAAGRHKVYFKADGNLYKLDSAGVESQIDFPPGANVTLSNLTSPTAINQDLLPSVTNTRAIGALTNIWSVIHAGVIRAVSGATPQMDLLNSVGSVFGRFSAGAALPSGLSGFTALFSGLQSVTNGLAMYSASDGVVDANPTGDVRRESGNKTAGTGDSGDIIDQTGTSAGGLRGKGRYLDGTEGTVGHVLTSISTTGRYEWAAPAGGGAGGGGAGGLTWQELGSSPLKSDEFNTENFLYDTAVAQDLFTQIEVIPTYTALDPITMRVNWYSPDTSGTGLLRAEATLIRPGTDAFNSTTNQRTTTNAAVSLTIANNLNTATLDLTDAGGLINAVGVSAGDIIKIRLFRDTDTGTSDIRFLPSIVGVSYE